MKYKVCVQLGKKIKRVRKQNKISQEELTERIGWSEPEHRQTYHVSIKLTSLSCFSDKFSKVATVMDIENLAKKFKTSPEEVKEIFEQMKQEKRQEIQKAIEDNLEKATVDGKITQQQKDTISAKLSDIRKKRMELREAQEDLENWAEENKVELESILLERDFHRHRGFRGF